ncbi:MULTISPECIES: hypothetical protein [unclassified Streptomyces]|uniref:hypothetical protein n=1 Tax=unclassified Streptomyces TaxID=2593676 RepID=UPI00344EE321
MAASLLVVATALPVSLIAGPALAADHRATPAARPDDPLDDYAADPPLAAERLEEQYPGHPGAPARLPDFPGADDFLDFRDDLLGFSGILPGFPHHLGGPFAHGPHHHLHRPFDPRFPWRPDPAPDFGDGALDDSADADPAMPSAPPSAPVAAPVQLPPGRPAPTPDDAAPPAASDSGPAAAEAARPSPARPRGLAAAPAPAPAPAPHRPAPSPTPEQDPDHADAVAGPAPATSPYALEAPSTRVERVLPLGAGMALTGLGLAFLGLRLRRR